MVWSMSKVSAADRLSDTTTPQDLHHLSPMDLYEQYRILVIFFYTIFHFFGDFRKMFADITDHRTPKKVVYPPDVLAFAGILMFICGLKARRQIQCLLRRDICAENFRELFGVPDCPHGDTLNDAFALMDPAEIQAVVYRMVSCLIRKKVFYPYRLLDRYFVIAIDGTWILTRKKRHCSRCLTQTKNDKTTYYHMVLEAKLVTTDGFAVPLHTEFVENTGSDSKQDCELKAFYRMAEKIKARFPRLPILLSIDGLFACGPVFEVCRKQGWKFMVVLKDGSLPTVNQEFESLCRLQPENRLTYCMLDGKRRIEQSFRWVNEIDYTDTEKRDHKLDVIECIETGKDAQGNGYMKKFKWATNLSISKRNAVKLANDGGRLRWKIENEGFNVQKNGVYGLTHMYSKNDNSAKIFHLLMQIAHLWMQLLIKGGMKRWFPKGVGSVKNVAFRLLEGWRNVRLPEGTFQWITGWRFQIRFIPDTS
jgi:hypothetical protein